MDSGIAVQGYDHGMSKAVQFSDLDGNDVELYWDCPQERWTYVEGGTRLGLRHIRRQDRFVRCGNAAVPK